MSRAERRHEAAVRLAMLCAVFGAMRAPGRDGVEDDWLFMFLVMLPTVRLVAKSFPLEPRQSMLVFPAGWFGYYTITDECLGPRTDGMVVVVPLTGFAFTAFVHADFPFRGETFPTERLGASAQNLDHRERRSSAKVFAGLTALVALDAIAALAGLGEIVGSPFTEECRP